MANNNRITGAGRTKRRDKIDAATIDMLSRIKALRPELRADALAQFLLFASHVAGIKAKAREAA